MSVFNAYMALSGAFEADVLRDERLSHHTTYRIGGPAALMVTAHSYKALLKTIDILRKEGVEWVVMGRGSNILVADEGYDGCVIKLGKEFSRISFEGDTVSAGGGAILSKLVSETISHSLSGLEFCVGIPGTVGGAVSMDAGTRHDWIGSRVHHVVTLRPQGGLQRYEGSDIEWPPAHGKALLRLSLQEPRRPLRRPAHRLLRPQGLPRWQRRGLHTARELHRQPGRRQRLRRHRRHGPRA